LNKRQQPCSRRHTKMTGSELSVPISEKKITEKFLTALMNTPTIPTRFRESPTGFLDLVATIKYGEELGVGPFTSMYQIYLVNGSGSLQGQLMLSKVWAAGHMVKIDIDELASVVHCYRVIDGEMTQLGEVEFTVEDANRAGLLNVEQPGTYEKYIKHMLTWRAVAFACRLYYPDLFVGTGAMHPSEVGVDAPAEGLPEYVDVTVADAALEDYNVENAAIVLDGEIVDG